MIWGRKDDVNNKRKKRKKQKQLVMEGKSREGEGIRTRTGRREDGGVGKQVREKQGKTTRRRGKEREACQRKCIAFLKLR